MLDPSLSGTSSFRWDVSEYGQVRMVLLACSALRSALPTLSQVDQCFTRLRVRCRCGARRTSRSCETPCLRALSRMATRMATRMVTRWPLMRGSQPSGVSARELLYQQRSSRTAATELSSPSLMSVQAALPFVLVQNPVWCPIPNWGLLAFTLT